MNSKIILASNINMDREYTNVLDYTENQMLSLCENNAVASANNYSFLRPTGNILVDIPYSQCIQSNYMAFQNPDYSNKWFFAFIDDIIYKGDKNCEIQFTIDSWSTWFDKWSKKICYIDRQHTNNDTIGLHTVPENLDVGEVIQESVTEDASYGNEYGYWIAIASNWKIKDNSTGDEILDSDKGTQYSGVTVYDNVVFGSLLFLIQINDETSFEDLYLFISRTNMDGHIQDIENIFIVPDIAITPSALTSHTAKLGQNLEFTFFTMDYDMQPAKFNTPITKISSFRDYTPKNNKCFVYPYNYILVSNNQGSQNIYKYENFSTSNCIFENQFSISIGGSGRLVPKNYKGMETNDDEALPLGKYPTCSWSSDAFTNWLTQNSVNMAVSLGLTAGAIAGTIATGGATLPIAIGTTTTVAGSIGSSIGQFHQSKLLPNISGGQATGDIIWSVNRNLFTIRQMRCKTEYIKIIDDYFSRFGYAVKRLELPNINGRRYWNFIQIGQSEEIGYGDVPSKYMDIINNACRRGVTIWHNHENIGNYSLNNTII